MAYRRHGKRLIDIGVSSVLLILLLPVLILTALLVRFRLGRDILFRQERAGIQGRPFTIVKFRTMTDECDAEGRPLPDDARLTATGRLLRSLSLDELPELLNVLVGEMSLVGPRPLLLDYLDLYTTEQMRRHEVQPGITGLAQVSGRNALSWEERFELDVWYVDHLSLWLDARILVLTVWKTLRREGISAAKQATMHPFSGGRD